MGDKLQSCLLFRIAIGLGCPTKGLVPLFRAIDLQLFLLLSELTLPDLLGSGSGLQPDLSVFKTSLNVTPQRGVHTQVRGFGDFGDLGDLGLDQDG